MLYVLLASISSPTELSKHSGLLLYPIGINFGAYTMVFANPDISTGYLNTLFYVFVGTILNVILTVMGAYVLSRKWLKIRNFLMFLIVFTMFVNGGLIPSFLLIKGIGLYDTRWALLIPGVVSTWNLIMTRTYFNTIPPSLEESAKIDGANDFIILFRIMVPLAVPIIAVITLYYAVGHWNSWFSASIYLQNKQLFPLQLFLREILVNNNTSTLMSGVSTIDKEPISDNIKYATIVASTLPVLLLYPFLQRYFVNGIMIGAVKE